MESGYYTTGWSTKLETGITVIDEQHRRYFELLDNYLQTTEIISTTPEEVLDLAETLNFLRQYAKEHFSTEESIMKTAKYPAFEPHQEQHLYFLDHVEMLYERMRKEGFSPELAREVNYYTIEWFIDHIRVKDVKLAEFLKQEASKDK
jgi:hemerythrin